MADENLSFSIIARDQASSAFRETARSATDLAGKMDIAARTGRVLDETLRKEVRAGDELSKSFAVSAKAADILKAAERELSGEAAIAADELRRVKREADRLDGTRAQVHVKVEVDQSQLSRVQRLLGGGSSVGGVAGWLNGGSGGGGGGGASSLLSGGLTSPVGIGAGILGAAALAPSVVGLGLGGAAGLGAIGGGLFGAAQGTKILKADTANITHITTALKTAIGQQKQQLSAALKDANKQFAKDSNFYAPFLGFQKSLKDLVQVFLKPLRPLMAPLTQLFDDFGKGLAKLGPVLTQVLDASIPFVHTFLNVLLKAGSQLLPAFSYALNQMVSSGALELMTQGLVILTKGLADFIVALGPGMRSSALIFRDLMVITAGALKGVGLAASWVANTLEDYFHRVKVNLVKLAAQFDDFRHRTAVVFDGIRHDIAHTWDQIFSNSIGRLIRFVANDQRLMDNLRHSIASTFDTIRHNIASAWDTIWNNSVGRVQRGVSDVVGWFKGLPGKAVGALFGLGHSLAAFASSAMGQMWTGFKNVFSSVIHWFTGLPKMILHALGIKSPPDWAISAGKHIMAGLHIGLGHGLGQLTSFTSSIGNQVAAGLAGAFGGSMGDSGARTHSAAVAQRYAASILGQYGWSQSQMGSLIPLWNQESGWSAYAVNPSSGAYGIPQSLGHGHPYNLGDYVNQIIWGLNYIRGRYGSPAAAWGHEQRFNWYAGGTSSAAPGWAVVGERGPELLHFGGGEQVYPQSAGGSNHYTINVYVPVSANKRETGREIVGAIKAFEQGSGPGWRK